MGNMGSAHPLVEVNVSFKFEGNPSTSKEVIQRTRIGDGPTDGTKVNPVKPPPHILWWGYKNYQLINKRAQRALGRSPEEKVKGRGEAIILLSPNIGRELLDDAIYQI